MNNIDREQKWRHRLVNWLCCSAGLTALVAGLAQLVAGNASLAGTGLAAGLLLLMAGTVERFDMLKGLGLEAKVSRKLNETEAVLAQTRQLADLTGATLLKLTARAGRSGGAPPAQEAYDLSRTIKHMLEGLGAAPSTVRAALEPWARTAATDLVFSIVGPYYDHINSMASVLKSDGSQNSGQQYALKLVNDWQELSLGQFTARLREIAGETIPNYVPSEVAARLRKDVAEWAPRIDFLALHFDLADPIRDIQRIRWQMEGRTRPWD